jgi:preprotein translocase subunit SecE
LPRRVELVQSTLLIAVAVIAITLVLPALLGLAAAPSR